MMKHHVQKKRYKNSDIDIIVLKNSEIEVHISSLGCTVISILTKDKHQQFGDIILGFDDVDLYLQQDKYIGAIVGRCAGRIKDATFTLHKKVYHLAKNNGNNTLHGGVSGFDRKLFDYKLIEHGVSFHYISKHMEEGFPGDLDVCITYEIEGSKLIATYVASCNQDSVVNITNHIYFNLRGKGSVLDHELQIHADEIIYADEDGCANKTHRNVLHTPFDFRKAKKIGKDIDVVDKQLEIGGGYDHYFIFNKKSPAVVLKDGESGRIVEVSTNQNGCQMYTANFLDGTLEGKNHWYFNAREAVCIETQAAPNAIHTETQPSTILKKGDRYMATTTYEFKIEDEENI